MKFWWNSDCHEILALSLSGKFPQIISAIRSSVLPRNFISPRFERCNKFLHHYKLDIYLRWRDLQEQRKETKDLQEIQRETANSLRDAMYATSFSKIYDILDDKSIIDARYAVYELEEVHYSEWREKEDWPEIERHIRTLLRAYNIAGIYVKHHFLLEKHIVPDWEPSLRKTWSILKPYVRERRIDRTMGPSGSGNHWQNYEQLAALADEWHTTQRNMPKSSVI